MKLRSIYLLNTAVLDIEIGERSPRQWNRVTLFDPNVDRAIKCL